MMRAIPTSNAQPQRLVDAFPLWVIAALVLGTVLVIGFWFYGRQAQQAQIEVEANLKVVAHLKAEQIAQWRAERLGDGWVLMNSVSFEEDVVRWMANAQDRSDDKILTRLRAMQQYNYYDDLLLVDYRKQIRLSISGKRAQFHKSAIQAMDDAFRMNQPLLTDLHLPPGDPLPHIEVVVPFFSRSATTNVPVAAVILRFEGRRFLYPLIQTWPSASASAETLLVRRDGDSVLFLNELRHQRDTALKLLIPLSRKDVPSVRAVLGQEGFFQGNDYRGVKVLSVLKRIPDSLWFMVAKMDEAEALAEWRFRARLILSVMLSLSLALVFVLALVGQERSRYQALAITSGILRQKSEELAEAQRLAHLGSWHWDAQTDATSGSEELLRLYGFDPATQSMPAFRDQKGRCYPDADWERINAAAQQTLQTGIGYDLQVKALRADGAMIWLAMHGLAVRDTAGRVTGSTGTAQDISERKQLEAEREGHSERLEQLVANRTRDLEAARSSAVSLMQDANEHRQRAEQMAAQMAASGERMRKRVALAQGLQKAGEVLSSCKTIRAMAEVAARTPVRYLDSCIAWISIPGANGCSPLVASSPDVMGGLAACECPYLVHNSGQKKIILNALSQPVCELCRSIVAKDGCASCGTWPILAGGKCAATLTIRCPEAGADSWLISDTTLIEVFCSQIGYIWDRLLTEEKLLQLTRVIEQSPVSILVTDPNGVIEYVNPYFTTVTGYTFDEARGGNLKILGSGQQSPEFYQEMWRTVSAGKDWHGDFHNRKKNGELYWERGIISALRNLDGAITHFVAVKEDITERKQIVEELEMAKEAAEAANRAKSLFLANMSHEIRTPLNAILGFSQLLQCEGGFMDTQREHLRTINRSGEHLLALINDILEMSKIEAGRTTFAPAPFDLHALLVDLENMLRLRAEAAGLQLEVQRQDDVPRWVTTDEGKLRQVLINLLNNAIKFTDNGGVTLCVKSVEGLNRESLEGDSTDISGSNSSNGPTLRFSVRDTGIGINPEEQARIFDAFEQAQKAGTMKEGTGLGLAISQGFVRLMGGEMCVQSRPGAGSVFSFTLPLVEASGGEAKVQEETAVVESLAPSQGEWRILVVDDEETNRQLLSSLLSSVGYQVRTTNDGQEALMVFQEWMPHCIFMDLRMPGMGGCEAARRIRDLPSGRQTVIIAATAYAFIEYRKEALVSGMNDFVAKPFRLAEVLQKIRAHLGVVYVHRAPAEAASGGPQEDDLAGKVACLPEGQRAELRNATLSGDIFRLKELIEAMAGEHPSTAQALHQLADGFEIAKLNELFQKR